MALLSRTYVRYNYKKGDGYMETICTLAPDINSCPHYDQKKEYAEMAQKSAVSIQQR